MARKAVVWQAGHPRATLEELEEALLQLRAEFSQELARVLLEHREAAAPVPGVNIRAKLGHHFSAKLAHWTSGANEMLGARSPSKPTTRQHNRVSIQASPI
jgi:hypothetical protein